MSDEALRYPIGKFQPKESYTPEEIAGFIAAIQAAPDNIEAVCKKLSPSDYNKPYRPGGWTARQVIHHLADSHMHAYIRCKWSLTESTPTIKAYDEKLWAETYDTTHDPSLSIQILKTLHAKWVVLLKSLTPTDLEKGFIHPQTGKLTKLNRVIATYAWHGEHHLGHLTIILNSNAQI